MAFTAATGQRPVDRGRPRTSPGSPSRSARAPTRSGSCSTGTPQNEAAGLEPATLEYFANAGDALLALQSGRIDTYLGPNPNAVYQESVGEVDDRRHRERRLAEHHLRRRDVAEGQRPGRRVPGRAGARLRGRHLRGDPRALGAVPARPWTRPRSTRRWRPDRALAGDAPADRRRGRRRRGDGLGRRMGAGPPRGRRRAARALRSRAQPSAPRTAGRGSTAAPTPSRTTRRWSPRPGSSGRSSRPRPGRRCCTRPPGVTTAAPLRRGAAARGRRRHGGRRRPARVADPRPRRRRGGQGMRFPGPVLHEPHTAGRVDADAAVTALQQRGRPARGRRPAPPPGAPRWRPTATACWCARPPGRRCGRARPSWRPVPGPADVLGGLVPLPALRVTQEQPAHFAPVSPELDVAGVHAPTPIRPRAGRAACTGCTARARG